MWEETSKIQVVEPQEVLTVSCRGDSGDTRFTVTRLPHPTRDKSYGLFTFAHLPLLIQDKNEGVFTVVYLSLLIQDERVGVFTVARFPLLIQDERDGIFTVTRLPHPTREGDGKLTATNRSTRKKRHHSASKHCTLRTGGVCVSWGIAFFFFFFFHLL